MNGVTGRGMMTSMFKGSNIACARMKNAAGKYICR
jgi:hypothetical protein